MWKGIRDRAAAAATTADRRGFLTGAAIAAGAAIAVPPMAYQALQTPVRSDWKEAEHLHCNGVTVVPIVTEHDQDAWDNHGQEIVDELPRFDFIVPEYMTKDLVRLRESSLVRPFAKKDTPEDVVLFAELEAIYPDLENTHVWVVDPVWNLHFAAQRAVLKTSVQTATLASLAANLYNGNKAVSGLLERRRDDPHLRFDRRDVLRGLAGVTGLATIGSIGVNRVNADKRMPTTISLENVIRHCISAAQMKEMCAFGVFPPGSMVAYIAPQKHIEDDVHIPGFSTLFNNDRLCGAFVTAAALTAGRAFPDQFDARYYENGEYTPTPPRRTLVASTLINHGLGEGLSFGLERD